MQRFIPLVLLATLSACTAVEEPIHDVSWYKDHQAERAAKLQECRANPGALAQTANCRNADAADTAAKLGRKKPFSFPVVR